MAEQTPSTGSGSSDTPLPTPSPESSEPIVPPPTPSTGSGSSGLEPNIAAGLACIFPLVGGFVFLLIEKKSAYVRFYAMQSILMGATMFCTWVVFAVAFTICAHIPFIGWLVAILGMLVYMVVGLAFLAIYIVNIVKAFSGKEWEIPVLGPIARRQLVNWPI